jgi:hypothetical protein
MRVYNSSVKELIMNRIKYLVFTLSSRVRYTSTVVGIILCCVLGTVGFAACTSPAGGSSAPTYYPYTLTTDIAVIKITETDTPPLAKAATTPVTGNYYWVFFLRDRIDQEIDIDDNVVTVTFNSGGDEFVLIDQGTVSVDDTASITFKSSNSNSHGEFILKPSGDGYILDGKIDNSLTGKPITIETPFTDSGKEGKTDPIGVYPVVSTLDGVVTGYKSLNAAIAGADTGSRIILYANQIIAYGTGLANKTLTLTGYGENRTITHTPGAAMFALAGSDHLILDANITLDGEGTGWGDTWYNNDNEGPLVSVTGSSTTLEMKGNAIITGGLAVYAPTTGAVYIEGGSFIMGENARIRKNKANAGRGGGVHINGGSLIMKNYALIGGADGADTENVASMGGGVCVTNGGSLIMNDYAGISGNRATGGGGVYVTNGGSVTMNVSAVIKNNNMSRWGGGVYMEGGTFTVNNQAEISGNWANYDLYSGSHGPGYGGGVYIQGGTFTVVSGTITGNRAQYTHTSNGPSGKGGGVYITGGTFAIPAGDLSTYVSGNSADNSAGNQIYKYSGTFKIGEAPQEGGPWN